MLATERANNQMMGGLAAGTGKMHSNSFFKKNREKSGTFEKSFPCFALRLCGAIK